MDDLITVLEQELLRVDPQTSGARAKAELMAGPIADWIQARFVAWVQQGVETLEGNDYWSRQVEL